MSLRLAILLACLVGCTPYTATIDDVPAPEDWLARPRAGGLPTPGVATKREARSPLQGGAREPIPATTAEAFPIDLETALRLAGKQAVPIQLARSRAREAGHVASEALTRVLPELRPIVSLNRIEGDVQATRGTFVQVKKQNSYFGGGLEFVLQPAEALFALQAARHREHAASERVASTANATYQRVAKHYFGLVADFARVRIAEDAVKAAAESLSVEQARVEAGAGLQAAVARARARLAEARGDVASAKSRTAVASAGLAALLMLDGDILLVPKIEDAGKLIELADVDEPFAKQLERALGSRPELRVAAAEVEASRSERSAQSIAWAFPELRLGASYGSFGFNFGNTDGQTNYWAALQWKLNVGVLPRAAAARERVLRAELHQTLLRQQVSASLSAARAGIQAARARTAAARGEVAAATEALSLVQSRQRAGETTVLEVLDAQAALTRARTNLVVAVADHNAGQYALLQALGGARAQP